MNGRKIFEKIGQGNFGRVYAAQNIRTGQPEVVKVVPKSEAAKREVYMHLLLPGHSNLVQLLEVVCSRNNMYMFMTHGGSRTLFHCIKHHMYSFDGSLDVFDEISDAVIFMHGLGVCHLDIKPENVLVDDDDVPRIADFGTAGRTNRLITNCGGTFPFAAPEILDKMSKDNDSDPNSQARSYVIGYHGDLADVFSMGIMLLEMLQGNHYMMHRLGWAGQGDVALMRDPEARAMEMRTLLQDGNRLNFLRRPLPGGIRVPQDVASALDLMLQPRAARRQSMQAADLVLFPEPQIQSNVPGQL